MNNGDVSNSGDVSYLPMEIAGNCN